MTASRKERGRMSRSITARNAANVLITHMKASAACRGRASIMSHTPYGGAIIFIGAGEEGVLGTLVSVAAEIEAHRTNQAEEV